MTNRRTPCVLIVDDRPDDAAKTIAQRLAKLGLQPIVEHPADVEEGQLREADVLLVDYDLKDWDQGDLPPSNYCASGWSLAALLRDRGRQLDVRSTVSVTALLTSQIDAATMPFQSAGREHISADLNGIEWVFDKADKELEHAVSSLAQATMCVESNWSLSDIYQALGVESFEVAKCDDVVRCRPPLSECLNWQDGLGFMRWLLHRVLPYPTFLIDENYIAAQLGVSTADVKRLVAGHGALGAKLNAERYAGLLRDFAGTRWWRVGIDAALWELTGGQPGDTAKLRGLVGEELGELSNEVPASAHHLVTCYDERLRPHPFPVDVAEAQRIWPDDWPQYASQPWALKEEVKNHSSLQRIAMPQEAA